MSRNLEKGSASPTVLIMLLLIFMVVLVALAPRSSTRERSSSTPLLPLASGGGSVERVRIFGGSTQGSASVSNSPDYKSIRISRGSAPYEYQPDREYITITNSGRTPVNITGWTLTNARDTRPEDRGGTLYRSPRETAFLPRAISYISPLGIGVQGDVVLAPGETAVVTSGRFPISNAYKITSFKENKCSPYLENERHYDFEPPLRGGCPRPLNEPGVENLDTECRDFISRLPSCRAPEIGTRDRDGEFCATCINRVKLSRSCRAFIEDHFNYKGCVAYHASDANFSGNTWRIFLERGWEMWAEDYETISLFDSRGNLVKEYSY